MKKDNITEGAVAIVYVKSTKTYFAEMFLVVPKYENILKKDIISLE